MGIWLLCDGTDTEDCPEKLFTANVYAKTNRAHWAKTGWGRGLRKATKTGGGKLRDLCPKHMKIERELFATQQADQVAEKKRRAELKKAKVSATPLPKKVRKKKGSTSQPPAHPELAGGVAPGSPSADSAAAATQ